MCVWLTPRLTGWRACVNGAVDKSYGNYPRFYSFDDLKCEQDACLRICDFMQCGCSELRFHAYWRNRLPLAVPGLSLDRTGLSLSGYHREMTMSQQCARPGHRGDSSALDVEILDYP